MLSSVSSLLIVWGNAMLELSQLLNSGKDIFKTWTSAFTILSILIYDFANEQTGPPAYYRVRADITYSSNTDGAGGLIGDLALE